MLLFPLRFSGSYASSLLILHPAIAISSSLFIAILNPTPSLLFDSRGHRCLTDTSPPILTAALALCPDALCALGLPQVLKNRILPACDKLGQTIVFVKQRKDAKRLHMALHDAGWKCTSISGGASTLRRCGFFFRRHGFHALRQSFLRRGCSALD